MDEGLKFRGLTASAYGPQSKAIAVDWDSVSLVKFNEVDFDVFRTERIPENLTISDDDE